MAQDIKDILPKSMVQTVLNKMNFGGHNPMYQNTFIKIYSHYSLVLLAITWPLQVVYVFTTEYTNYGFMIMDLVLISAVWQVFTKSFMAHWKRKYILRLVDIVDKDLWTNTSHSLSEEEHLKSQQIYKYCLLITKAYSISIYFTMFGHCATAVLRGNHNLIMNCWFPETVKSILFSPPYFYFLVLIQFHLMAVNAITGLIQMDNLFCMAILIVLAQLQILKKKFSSIGSDKTKNNNKSIIELINHHNLLFEVISIVETIFSSIVLNFCATDVLLGVVCLLGLLLEKNITQLVELIFILISVFGQLYVYCLLGQLIQDETLSVATAAYSCQWEDLDDNNIKKSLLMTIQRSQKPALLTMGGMLNLNLENFTRVARLMLSILTLMVNTDIA